MFKKLFNLIFSRQTCPLRVAKQGGRGRVSLWLILFRQRRISLWLIISIGLLTVAYNFVLAVATQTVVLTGDDVLQNGGADDAYDSLLVADITASQANPDEWQLEYSNDGGNTWQTVIASYTQIAANRRQYYWSTSKIYAPTLLFRTRTRQGADWSEYFQATLALTHRATNHDAHYFVESFNDSAFKDGATNATWDTARALVELRPNPPEYHPNALAYSTDLLGGIANQDVLSVTFQPVQWPFSVGTIKYQLSNNGTNWYGDTSGNPQAGGGLGGTWFIFANQKVPLAVTVPFNGPTGQGLYWRIKLETSDNAITPQVYQLRFSWSENSSPQACFINEPPNSSNPEQSFDFDARCSADYEDTIAQLRYSWDFNNDGAWEVTDQLGTFGYTQSYNFHSTSTQTIVLRVKDRNNATDTFTGQVNTGGVAAGIYGWAWSSNFGWTSLNCDNVYYTEEISYCPPNYGLTLHPNNTIDGWAWDSNIGWLCFGSTCTGQTPWGASPVAVYDQVNGQISGWGKYIVFGDNGWLLMRDTWCGADPNNDQCAHVNLSRRTLEGYGWSGFLSDDQGVAQGVGWVNFAGNISVPWLETKFGAVYGRAQVGSNETFGAPEGRYNSTYCIRSNGDIVNFTSQQCQLQPAYRDLDFPASGNKYRTILGVIDFNRILNGEEVSLATADVDQALNQARPLAGQVYHFSGETDYTIDAPLTFYHARNLDSSGAGTIIIDGNLHINSNLFYENSPVTSQIENLASVAWIIRGDVFIGPAVSRAAGNFIVLGREPAVQCTEQGQSGCGEFHTGDDSASPRQLVVAGLVMARKFYLERYFKQSGEPAEKIIYDGRVIVNTPPGLEDVAKGLPIWREALATTKIE